MTAVFSLRASRAIAEEPVVLRNRFEAGTVLSFEGKAEIAFEPKLAELPTPPKQIVRVASKLFVLAVDDAGGARVAVHERTTASRKTPDGQATERERTRLDAGRKGAGGSWSTDPLFSGAGLEEMVGPLLLGPEVLPGSGVANGAEWKGSFNGRLLMGLPLTKFEAVYTLEKFEGEAGERVAVIRIDLGGIKPETLGPFSRDGLSIAFKEGSHVRYRFLAEAGRTASVQIAMTLETTTGTPQGDVDIVLEADFEGTPPSPPSPDAARLVASALTALGKGSADEAKKTLGDVKKSAPDTPWDSLAEALEQWNPEPSPDFAPAPDKKEAPLPPPESFEPSKVTLDLKSVKVSAVLEAIEKQTGNRVSVAPKVNDELLPAFQAEDEPYWVVLDRLCEASNNVYGTEAFRDGG
jgi:hypothetical protein